MPEVMTPEEIREAVAAYRARFAVGRLCWVCLTRFDSLDPNGPRHDGARCESCRGVRLADVEPYADPHNNIGRRAGHPEPATAPAIVSPLISKESP